MKNKICWISGIMAMSASMVMGAVTVNFANNIPTDTDNSIPVSLILSFTVDGAGNVTLDASAPEASPTVTSAVKAWNGPVGTVSYAGAFNTKFKMDLLARAGEFRISANEEGVGGLGVAGISARRIDNDGKEKINVMAAIPAGQLSFSTFNWSYLRGKDTFMLVTVPSGYVGYKLSGDTGSIDVSADNIRVGNGQQLSIGTTVTGDAKAGYTLSGFTFDVIAESGKK